MRLSKAAMVAALIGAVTMTASEPAAARSRNTGAVVAAGVAGLVLGGLIASQARPRYYYYYYPDAPRVRYYYGPPVYYGPPPVYYGRPIYAADPAIAYCMRRFKSYDPYTMTYLGYDGYRHPCP